MGYFPTVEELTFVYQMIQDGYTNREILEEYARQLRAGQLVYPLRSDPRFVKARRRELQAAEAVLQEHIRRRTDPVLAQRREQHFNNLADIAQKLLEGGVRDIIMIAPDTDNPNSEEYVITSGVDPVESMGLNGLRHKLRDNLHLAFDTYGMWDVNDCLQTHLKLEGIDFLSQGIERAIQDNPYEFIEILRVLAQRQTFNGTCPVCRNW
ncbi:hypothetical protein ACFLXH_05865 [Chloroflexota bacterium]